MPTRPSSESHLPERNTALDGIRGIAILMVLLWHLYALVPRPEWTRAIKPLEWFAGIGWSGVQLFFVLSGFLIAQNLLRMRGSEHYYRHFYIRRAARILPLYFLCLALFWIVREGAELLNSENTALLAQGNTPLWQYVVFIQNYAIAANNGLVGGWLGVTWSLAIEEQFYLIFPALVALSPVERLGHYLVVLAVAPPVLCWLILTTNPDGIMWVVCSLPTRIDAFAIGALLALALKNGWRPKRSLCAAAGFFALIIFVTTPSLIAYAGLAWRTPLQSTYFFSAAIAFGSLVGLASTSKHGWLTRLLELRPLVWFGWTSYALYLFHEPVFWITHWTLRNAPPALNTLASAATSLLALIVLILLVEGLRRYIEKPIIAAARRVTTE